MTTTSRRKPRGIERRARRLGALLLLLGAATWILLASHEPPPVDPAWDGINRAALFHRLIDRDQRAATKRCFHHHHKSRCGLGPAVTGSGLHSQLAVGLPHSGGEHDDRNVLVFFIEFEQAAYFVAVYLG